jgi:hypothetical protein
VTFRMARLEDVIGYGTHAARPSAGRAGVLYYESDTDTLFRDNGTSWDELTVAGGGASAPTVYTDTNANNITTTATNGSLTTLLERTITAAPAGVYRVEASCWLWTTAAGSTRLQAASTVLHELPTHAWAGPQMQFGAYSHAGGDLTIGLYHVSEGSSVQYGNANDGRWGRRMFITGPN